MKMNEFGAATPLISCPTHLITCKKKKRQFLPALERNTHLLCISWSSEVLPAKALQLLQFKS